MHRALSAATHLRGVACDRARGAIVVAARSRERLFDGPVYQPLRRFPHFAQNTSRVGGFSWPHFSHFQDIPDHLESPEIFDVDILRKRRAGCLQGSHVLDLGRPKSRFSRPKY